jgi:prophage regulatory protein
MSPYSKPPIPDPVMQARAVSATISYSVSQLYRMVKAGTFPKPLRLGPGRVGWRQSVVDTWINSRQQNI